MLSTVALAFSLFLIRDIDRAPLYFAGKSRQSAPGTVTASRQTAFKTGCTYDCRPEQMVHAVSFTFIDTGGTVLAGISYRTGAGLPVRSAVTIEIASAHPEHAPIVGARAGPYFLGREPAGPGLLVLICAGAVLFSLVSLERLLCRSIM